MAEVVRYEVDRGVAIVTIDRPEVRNAMDPEVFAQLRQAAQRAGAAAEVRAVVVRGSDGAFSSGIDLGALGQLVGRGDLDEATVLELQASFHAFEDLEVPVLAAVEGPCLGAGLQLALACHLRAVAPDATLAIMEARWGLVPDLGGTIRLPRAVGLGRATELTLTGRKVSAQEALAIGLAEIQLGQDAQAEALELARRLAAGPGALGRAVRLLRENAMRDRNEASRAEAQAQLACLAGPDFVEAVTAHLERREPRFVGR